MFSGISDEKNRATMGLKTTSTAMATTPRRASAKKTAQRQEARAFLNI